MNPIAQPPESEFKIKLLSAKPLFINPKISIDTKTEETNFNANNKNDLFKIVSER